MTKKLSVESLCVQGGYNPKSGDPRVVPIVQSTTYKYENADEVGELFDLEREGFFYTRLANPTVAALEEKVAALEGGVAAVATSAGQSATLNSILTICAANDHIVAMNNLYGGTYNLLGSTLERLGIHTTFVPVNDLKALEDAIGENTKLVIGETIGNPGVDVLDIEKVAEIAHGHGLPLFVDNTFATPALCRPLEFGADVVLHSSSKYLDGHAVALGGIIVDGGTFPWDNGKFPCLTEPDPNYHGLSYTESFGAAAFAVRCRAVFIRDIGNIMAPFNAFLTNLGTETLHLRMKAHSENALNVAKYLENHPKVEWISYPGLPTNKNYPLVQKYLPKGASGIIAFGVKGGAEASKNWINHLKMATLVVHVGDLRTHALHPASTTHRQLGEEALRAGGILPNMIRLSVGIENVEDIIADLEQAF